MVGLVIFAIGLFKKTVIADTLSSYANLLFTDAAHGKALDVTLQLAGCDHVHASALLRFFRLFRHGDRPRADIRRQAASQLSLAPSGSQRDRLLAALAHDASALHRRLYLSAPFTAA